ncbi:MAG: hypothetical protein COC24_015600 [Alphaproteobacteria bacterium]|nr:hypothetical protein [Alphaproteobacteria bacterium]
MHLKFEKNRIRYHVSKIEALELLKVGHISDQAHFPSGHTLTFRVETTESNKNKTKYVDSTLTFLITYDTVARLAQKPTKEGVIFLQDKVAYSFEIDMREERRKRIRKI